MKQQRTQKTVFFIASIAVCLALSAFVISFVTKGSGNRVFAIPYTLVFAFSAFLLFHAIGEKQQPVHPLFFGILLAVLGLTMLIRVSLLPHESDDFVEYLSIWLEDIRALPGLEAVKADIGNYNMPYFYFLFALGKLLPQSCDLYTIKLLSVLFDYILAYFAVKLVGLRTSKQNILILSFFVTLMVPSVIVNSAMWGQCDSIFSALALAGLYHGLKKQSIPCWACFAAALSVKLQTVFLLPIVLVFLFTGNVRLKDVWAFPAVFVGLLIPAMAAGRSFLDCVTIYWRQANTYSELSMIAANLYAWLPVGTRSNIPVAAAAVFAAGTVVLCFILYLFHRKNRLSTESLFYVGFIFTVMIPFLLPMMHDRYYYLADTLAAVYIFYKPERWYIPALVIIPSFLCHTTTLFEAAVIPTWALSFCILGALCMLLYDFVKELETRPAL